MGALTTDAEIEVRVSIRFRDLAPGDVVIVDPSDPYIAKLLRAGWLVPTVPSVEEQGSTSVTDEG